MTLPYDYARCAGTTHPTCQWCRRREPGREQWQIYIVPPIDTLTGECSSFIEPPRTCVSNNTTPNVELSGRTNRRNTAKQRRFGLSSEARSAERA